MGCYDYCAENLGGLMWREFWAGFAFGLGLGAFVKRLGD